MLNTNINPDNAAECTIKNYLTVLGMELSDLIEINGSRIIKGEFREQKDSNYMHGLYLALYKKNTNLIIHVQAHTILSFDPMDPLIKVYLRETPSIVNNHSIKLNKLLPIKELLEENNYGQYPLQVAVLIATKYDRFCEH